jgi:hypothetical protein
MALEEDDVDAHIVDGEGLLEQPRRQKGGEAAEAEELRLPGTDQLESQDVSIARLPAREDQVGNRWHRGQLCRV